MLRLQLAELRKGQRTTPRFPLIKYLSFYFFQGQSAYDWLGWFLRMQMFSYLGMAFQLLHAGATLRFWRSIGFAGHLCLPILYALGILIVRWVDICLVVFREKWAILNFFLSKGP